MRPLAVVSWRSVDGPLMVMQNLHSCLSQCIPLFGQNLFKQHKLLIKQYAHQTTFVIKSGSTIEDAVRDGGMTLIL